MTNRREEKSGQVAAHKKKWRKVVLIILFILMNVAVIAAAGFSEFGNSENAAALAEVQINGWWLVPAVACFLVAVVIDIYKYVLMMRRMASASGGSKERNSWKVARRTVLLGRYYDNVTPAAVGGQPFQIYYMRKNSGLKKGDSTSIPVFGMISIQIAFIIIALICFLFGEVARDNPVLYVTAWFGLLFFAFWPVMVAGTFLFPKLITRFVKWLVKILDKLKIVKNRKEAFSKVEDEITEYADSVKTILKTKGLFAEVLVISLVYNILIASIPFFVLTAFGGNMDFGACFVLTIAVMSAVYFIPTPGNSGAAEGTFFLVFSALSTGYVFWAMLVWRFFAYYIYIIIGWIIYMVIHFEKRRNKVE